MRRPVLAVLGGSFDPPHLGHVLIPTYVLARGLAERVLVAPCWTHPFAKQVTPFAERIALTRLAMAVHGDRVEVSDIEARLAARRGAGPSYSYDLLRAIAEEHPDADVRLVIGSDIVVRGELERWHRYVDIACEFRPIIVPRMGFSAPEHCALPEISSSAVRAWLARGDDDSAAREALAASVPAAVLHRLRVGHRGHVWLIGQGHVAAHAAPWLHERGWTTATVPGRGLVDGTAELPAETPAAIWLLCQDQSLPGAAAALLARGAPRVPTLHAAGALPARVALALLAAAGVPVATLHPICSLRREQPRGRLGSCWFGIEGDPAARDIARAWICGQGSLDLQGLGPEERVRYHAACALAGNHLAVLSERSAEVLRGLGLPADASARAIGELMRSALDNLLLLGVPRGVSGPAARGDAVATERHATALSGPAETLYRALSGDLVDLLHKPG